MSEYTVRTSVYFVYAGSESFFSDPVTAILISTRRRGGWFDCYSHIGQHSSAHRDWITSDQQRPATPEEYAPLLAEMEARGYANIHPVGGIA